MIMFLFYVEIIYFCLCLIGLGSKLCNIFSSHFIVETVDEERKLKYVQHFKDNMSEVFEPEISKYNGKPFTSITMKPDFARFQLEKFDTNFIRLVEKRAFELCACTKNLQVYFNDQRIPIQNFEQFVELFPNYVSTETESSCPEKHFVKLNDHYEIAVIPCENFGQISFVNGINTHFGGTHVNFILDQLVEKITAKLRSRVDLSGTKGRNAIINNLFLFIRCAISKPTFDSQTKERLNTPSKLFVPPNISLNVKEYINIPDKLINKLLKGPLTDMIISTFEFHETKSINKNIKTSSNKKLIIPKLEDANMVHSRKCPSRCTIILTEGDSAKALAISGLSIVGRDYYGVFPLRGKVKNIRAKVENRDAARKEITSNVEVQNILKIVGLEVGRRYTSLDELRYGRIMVMTDADVDGIHIKGLLFNIIHLYWPELLSLGIFQTLLTPIVTATRRNMKLKFYSLPSYQKFLNETPDINSYVIKYYKGLGTSTSSEGREYFKEFRTLQYVYDEMTNEKIDLAFAKKRANDRKRWLMKIRNDNEHYFNENGFHMCIDSEKHNEVSFSEFIDIELSEYSWENIERSIGHIMDGLKPSQRKVLYSCLSRKLRKEIAVYQLTGYISEKTAYHHGEMSLNETIIKMAQNYVGSNNVEYLVPSGQFGTRLLGGTDHAAPRYIKTYLNSLTLTLFREEDSDILRHRVDDNQKIEPYYYVPILPVILMNGCHGIGTGWSTDIWNYNPVEIANEFINKLDNPLYSFSNLTPYFKGFRGTIEINQNKTTKSNTIKQNIDLSDDFDDLSVNVDENVDCIKYDTVGSFEVTGHNSIVVTELPIGTWTDDYQTFLQNCITKENSLIKDFQSEGDDYIARFVLCVDPELINRYCISQNKSEIEKLLKLRSTLTTSNMNLILCDSNIMRFQNVSDIMEYFWKLRFQMYEKRKLYILDRYRWQLEIIMNKVRFVEEIINGEIDIKGQTKESLIELLHVREYKDISMEYKMSQEIYEMIFGNKYDVSNLSTNNDTDASEFTLDEKNDHEIKRGKFHYLINMPIHSLTIDLVNKLKNTAAEKQREYQDYLNLSVQDIWRSEIITFRENYMKEEQNFIDEHYSHKEIKTNKKISGSLSTTKNKSKNNLKNNNSKSEPKKVTTKMSKSLK